VTIRDSDVGNSGVARALWAGAAVALAGAIGWGLLGAYAETQTWLIAVAVGVGVGWVMTRLVDAPSMSLQVAAVLFTLGAVVLGQILIIAFTINKNFGNFDFPLSFRLYREAISSGDITEDLLFGLGGGAIGAFYSVRMLRSKGAAQRAAAAQAPPPPPPA
jgi:hypothetical protein